MSAIEANRSKFFPMRPNPLIAIDGCCLTSGGGRFLDMLCFFVTIEDEVPNSRLKMFNPPATAKRDVILIISDGVRVYDK